MPKRKFVEFRDLPRPSNAKDSHLQQHDGISNILDHSKTALFRALKIARGFERQKLGRRQKTAVAEKELDQIKRIKLEIYELKALDLAKTAESHLYRSLSKIKSISACDKLPEHVRIPRQQGKFKDSVECLNVQARLFNSDVVQKALNAALDGIKGALGIVKQDAGGKKRLRAKDYANGQLHVREGEFLSDADSVLPTTQIEEEDEWEGISSSTTQSTCSHHSEPNDNEDPLSMDGDIYDRYASRLAASSDSSTSDDDSGSLHQDIWHSKLGPKQQHSDQHPPLSPSLSLSLSPSPSPPPHDSARPSNPLRPTTTNSTTFLPTLLTTGYYSGSDSDAAPPLSDDDNDQWGHRTQIRKNRMGQQARRALWEKKYKERANHLRNENGTRPGMKIERKSVDRNAGWDARKGAVGGREGHMRSRGKRRDSRSNNQVRDQKSTGANMDPVSNMRSKNANNANASLNGSKKPNADGPLHPSWEAARRAKEAKSIAKPMGKKVVF